VLRVTRKEGPFATLRASAQGDKKKGAQGDKERGPSRPLRYAQGFGTGRPLVGRPEGR